MSREHIEPLASSGRVAETDMGHRIKIMNEFARDLGSRKEEIAELEVEIPEIRLDQ